MPPNEIFGWSWILLGFTSGALIGLFFHDEAWMGGYGAHRRRLIRLGHISFFGLGILNILFAQSFARIALDAAWLRVASWSFIVGGISMPICCTLMAWDRRLLPIFSLPVLSLILGGLLTVLGMVRA